MPSLRLTPDLGPHERVTPTNEAGKANSNETPSIVAPTRADAAQSVLRADVNTQILVELRVISQLLIIGLNVTDNIDALRQDEIASLGN